MTTAPDPPSEAYKRALYGELLEAHPEQRSIDDLTLLLGTAAQEVERLVAELVEDGLADRTDDRVLATRAAVVADALQL
jgi:DNA-binding IclR family transcriptional regulator